MARAPSIIASRQVDGVGLIEYAEEPYRAYYLTPDGGKRRRKLPSVTTILREAWAKPELINWAARMGDGMARARDESTSRGRAVHSLIETYLTSGEMLDVTGFPDDYRPYLRSAAKFILAEDPEPEAVELLVCHPEFGYAGRLDLRARLRGRSQIVDFKTSPNGGVYAEAHLQTFAYELADERCGAPRAEGRSVVAITPDGYRIVEGADVEKEWGGALTWAGLRRGLLERLEVSS
jgi:hypothetical protein